MLISCPGRVQRAPLRERNESRDPAQRLAQRNMVCRLRSVVSPLGPGSLADARPGHEGVTRAKSRRAKRTVGRRRIHDVKQRSVVRSRGALLRPGSLFPFASTPKEGWAERRQAHYFCCRVCETRRSARVRRGASHDAGRSPLGAPPWRFSAGGRASISGISSGSVQRAPRSQVVMPGGRCPGPPEPAVTSRGRRTPLPAPPFRIVSGRRPSMSEDGNLCTINSLRSQYISTYRS